MSTSRSVVRVVVGSGVVGIAMLASSPLAAAQQPSEPTAPAASAPAADSAWPSFSFLNWPQDAFKGQVQEPPRRDDRQNQDVFEVKPVDVKPGQLREEAPVGEYRQPEWTTFRRFPSTRVYLQTPPGGVQFEQWFENRKSKDRSQPDETRLKQELEFGLGHRLQLDLYMNELHIRDGANSTYQWSGYSVELRYAFADWNQIWGNPTVYVEYTMNDQNHDGPDAIEVKALFGGELRPGWHWGANLVHERSLAAENSRIEESAVVASVSHTVVDDLLSVGATSEYVYESSPSAATPRDRTHELLLGPSFQLIPHPRAAIDVEPLWGLTGESHRLRMFVVFSWHF
jgi:hypothetical protein